MAGGTSPSSAVPPGGRWPLRAVRALLSLALAWVALRFFGLAFTAPIAGVARTLAALCYGVLSTMDALLLVALWRPRVLEADGKGLRLLVVLVAVGALALLDTLFRQPMARGAALALPNVVLALVVHVAMLGATAMTIRNHVRWPLAAAVLGCAAAWLVAVELSLRPPGPASVAAHFELVAGAALVCAVILFVAAVVTVRSTLAWPARSPLVAAVPPALAHDGTLEHARGALAAAGFRQVEAARLQLEPARSTVLLFLRDDDDPARAALLSGAGRHPVCQVFDRRSDGSILATTNHVTPPGAGDPRHTVVRFAAATSPAELWQRLRQLRPRFPGAAAAQGNPARMLEELEAECAGSLQRMQDRGWVSRSADATGRYRLTLRGSLTLTLHNLRAIRGLRALAALRRTARLLASVP